MNKTKLLCYIAAAIIFSAKAYAQNNNNFTDTAISKEQNSKYSSITGNTEAGTYKVYCEVVGNFIGTDKYDMHVDYGQKGQNLSYLVNENGEKKYFNSRIDALNYMISLGWELTESIHESTGYSYSYVFTKMVKNKDEINRGLYTKYDYKNRDK